MRRAASVVGIIGGALGLMIAVPTVFLGFGLMPGASGILGSTLVQVVLPVAALIGATRAVREPRLAGLLLTLCGVASSLLLNYYPAPFYLVAGVLALVGEREAPRALRATRVTAPGAAAGWAPAGPGGLASVTVPAAPASPASPARPLPAWIRTAGSLAAASGMAAGLASGLTAVSSSHGAEGVGAIFLLLGLAGAVLSGLGLAGARMCDGRPWEGGLLMAVGGLPAALAGLLAGLPLGLWGLASGAVLAAAGFGALGEARGRAAGPEGPGSERLRPKEGVRATVPVKPGPAVDAQVAAPARALPRLSRTSVALIAVAVLAGFYAAGRAVGFELALAAALPGLFGPRVEETTVSPLADQDCLAIGPMTFIHDFGWLDNETVWAEGTRTSGDPTVLTMGLDGEGRQRIVRGVHLVWDSVPLRDGTGFVFSTGSHSTVAGRSRTQVYLCLEAQPPSLLISGRFGCELSRSRRFLLCAGKGLSRVYDLSSAASVAEGPVIIRHDPEQTPSWHGDNLMVPPAGDPALTTWRVFVPTMVGRQDPITLPGRLVFSGDGRSVAVLVPDNSTSGGDTYQGQEILVYDTADLSAAVPTEPKARLLPRNGGVNWGVWADDGAKLAYLDGPAPGSYGVPRDTPTVLMLAGAPAFEPVALPVTAEDVWRPVSFSTDGRYLLAEVARTNGMNLRAGMVLDTITGTASALPSGPGVLDTDDTSWLGPSTLWIYPTPGDPGSGTWLYYDAATAQVTPCPWWVYAYPTNIQLSPDRRHVCVSVRVNPEGAFIGAHCTGFGPFEQLPNGTWLFVFPLGPG